MKFLHASAPNAKFWQYSTTRISLGYSTAEQLSHPRRIRVAARLLSWSSILRDVLQRRIRTQGEDSWWTGITKSLLGECVMRQGRFAEAEPLLVDGYDTLRDASGPLETALKRLVEFYETTGKQLKVQEYEALLAALAG